MTVGDIAPGSTKTETPGNVNSDFLLVDANTYGTLYLSTGTYRLDQQLLLNHPVTIRAAAGANATLVFTQPQSSPTPTVWSDAIQIRSSHVTLQGFSIQFAGSFLWTTTGGSATGVINAYPDASGRPPIDVTITGMNIQGPAQSLFDQATDPTASVAVSPVFPDSFGGSSLGSSWTVVGGTWSESHGTASQANAVWTTQFRQALVASPYAYPGAAEIVANVRLNSIQDDGRAGVSFDNDSGGNGYNLVFHVWKDHGHPTLAVQLLKTSGPGPRQSSPIVEARAGGFFLIAARSGGPSRSGPQGGGVDALFGKVWLTGTGEPATGRSRRSRERPEPEHGPARPGRGGREGAVAGHGRF